MSYSVEDWKEQCYSITTVKTVLWVASEYMQKRMKTATEDDKAIFKKFDDLLNKCTERLKDCNPVNPPLRVEEWMEQCYSTGAVKAALWVASGYISKRMITASECDKTIFKKFEDLLIECTKCLENCKPIKP